MAHHLRRERRAWRPLGALLGAALLGRPAEAHAEAHDASQLGSTPSLQLPSNLELAYQPVGSDEIEFTVNASTITWLGFGLSAGDTVSMGGGGQGADVMVCSEGVVKRYWLTGHTFPEEEGVEVPGSACTQASGRTSMTFRRSVAAANGRQLSLTPGTAQQVIFAHGDDGETAVRYHRSDRGGYLIDFGEEEPTVTQLELSDSSELVYLHMALMTVAWGACLPFGAAVAALTKSKAGASENAWFTVHRRVQMVGWLLQLLGLGAAIWYIKDRAATHLLSKHAKLGLVLVVVCTLQPLNALLRPHKTEPKSRARIAFELVHRGLGWVAVLGGVCNVWIGIALVADRELGGKELLVTSVIVAVVCLLIPLGFSSLQVCKPNNVITQWMLGVKDDGNYSQ